MIEVNVRFFGPVKDLAGTEGLTLELPPAASGNVAFDSLAARYPGLHRWRSSIRLAVNLQYVDFDHPLDNGDEVALIPPISGG